jgi:hypothetical protein
MPDTLKGVFSSVRNLISLLLAAVLLQSTILAQSPLVPADAIKPIQESQSASDSLAPAQPESREIKVAMGTAIEIESAYTISSLNLRPNDYLTFRVLIPIKVDGVIVIPDKALVTGRVVEAKRGGHWGKAGRLSWAMQNVIAVDGTRVPIRVQKDIPSGREGIKGTGHGGQVATEMVVFGALMFAFAPLVLMSGFKRGENAVLPEGKRFTVFVEADTVVKVPTER